MKTSKINSEKGLKICVEKNEMIPENRFEIQGDKEHGRTGAPIKARKNRESGVKHNFTRLHTELFTNTFIRNTTYSQKLEWG